MWGALYVYDHVHTADDNNANYKYADQQDIQKGGNVF